MTAITLSGCIPDSTHDNKLNEDSAESTSQPSHGIVSEDPPGADDWDKDSGESAGSEEEGPVESYEGCSNAIELWTEPDPLNHPCNFRLQDQNGDNVELYDFQGDVILLDFSTMWCGVCRTVADHVQEMHDHYTPFSILTVLTENYSGNPPDMGDLRDWATEHAITTAPVLAGDDSIVGKADDLWDVNGIPCFFVIDKDFYLRKIQPGWNETTMTEYIEELILE